MKIIFLDIDGVLNVIPKSFDKYGGIFYQHFVDNLAKIIDETGAKIVISSSWRFSGLLEIQDMWKDRNYLGEIIDVIPFANLGSVGFWKDNKFKRTECANVSSIPRGFEIKLWLDNTELNIENYVIIDDDQDMLYSQKDNFVCTHKNNDHPDCIDDGFGLTDICTKKAIKILNS